MLKCPEGAIYQLHFQWSMSWENILNSNIWLIHLFPEAFQQSINFSRNLWSLEEKWSKFRFFHFITEMFSSNISSKCCKVYLNTSYPFKINLFASKYQWLEFKIWHICYLILALMQSWCASVQTNISHNVTNALLDPAKIIILIATFQQSGETTICCFLHSHLKQEYSITDVT